MNDEAPIHKVKRAETTLRLRDYAGIVRARLGIRRERYRVEPGLYAVGSPGAHTPVLATSNYKMSFDLLRRELRGLDAWILVLDTKGVNVWCSAGKGTFSAEEIARRIKATGLGDLVAHREIVLPQLSAPGVAAHDVRRLVGFRAVFGPIRARDIKPFLRDNMVADDAMRSVTFDMSDRAVLIPIEISSRIVNSALICAAMMAASYLSGFHYHISGAMERAGVGIAAYLGGLIAGTAITPLLLPWLPGRALSVKGAIAGALCGVAIALAGAGAVGGLATASVILFASAVGSYTAMHFTGSTPYTSPTGVEREMHRAIPVQIAAALASLIMWIA